jgi:hypothetical protein
VTQSRENVSPAKGLNIRVVGIYPLTLSNYSIQYLYFPGYSHVPFLTGYEPGSNVVGSSIRKHCCH